MQFVATAPSNIALIKYWGKRDAARQWPANDSLSMTLSTSISTTSATITEGPTHQFTFPNSAPGSSTYRKAIAHLEYLAAELGSAAKLNIHSNNTFPTA